MGTDTYLLFRLRGGLYGLPALSVQEVTPLPELTHIADGPPSIAGVVSFRGRVIAVVDPSVRLGYSPQAFRLSDCVVVLQRPDRPIGLLVDEVLDVREIPLEALDSLPQFGSEPSSTPRFVEQMAKLETELVSLLNTGELDRLAEELPSNDEGFEEVLAPLPSTRRPDPDPESIPIFRERARSLAEAPEAERTRDLAPVAVLSLGEELFGVGLDTVREFADLRQVTPIPCCPPHILGAVNLRGEILPLVDVRRALQLPAEAAQSGSKMMVVQVGDVRAGVLVDSVLDVLHLAAAEVTPVPYGVASGAGGHITGTVRYEEKVLAVLDLPGIFSRPDWET